MKPPVRTQNTNRAALTRKRLLRSTESLFADFGFGGLTLRKAAEQSQTNLASAHYHYGSKEALVMEMLKTRIFPINQRRKEYLRIAKRKALGKALKTQVIFEALIAPIGEEIAKSHHTRKTLAQLVARTFTEPVDFIQTMHDRFFGEICEVFLNELRKTHPNVNEEELYWNFHLSVSSLLGVLAQHRRLEHFSNGLCKENDVNGMIRRLIVFVTQGFEAGVSCIDS